MIKKYYLEFMIDWSLISDSIHRDRQTRFIIFNIHSDLPSENVMT